MSAPATPKILRDTAWGPGDAALASCRHAWGTIATAIARLDDPPAGWGPNEVAEARAQLTAAAELVRAVGEAIGRAR